MEVKFGVWRWLWKPLTFEPAMIAISAACSRVCFGTVPGRLTCQLIIEG